MPRVRRTDEMSDFDMKQMLLLEEGLRRHAPQVGRVEARQRAVAEMPLVFDSPVLEAAARAGDLLLPSTLATVLGGVSRRSDWPARRQAFVSAVRDCHIAEARWRAAERSTTTGRAD